jgi:hypothetical protein
MIWIVSGPSSVGKSTFLKSDYFIKKFNIQEETDKTLFAYQVNESLSDSINETTFLHYNICRSIQNKKASRKILFKKLPLPLTREKNYTYEDTKWDIITSLDKTKMHVIVLVASKEELLKRISTRQYNEPLYTKESKSNYPKHKWKKLYKSLNFEKLYSSWCNELDTKNINYTLIDSSSTDYKLIINRKKLTSFFI